MAVYMPFFLPSAILSCLRYLWSPALRLFPLPATYFCLLPVSWKPVAASLAAGQIKRSSCTPIWQKLGYLSDDVMCPVFQCPCPDVLVNFHDAMSRNVLKFIYNTASFASCPPLINARLRHNCLNEHILMNNMPFSRDSLHVLDIHDIVHLPQDIIVM